MSLLSVDQALAAITAALSPLQPEIISMADAAQSAAPQKDPNNDPSNDRINDGNKTVIGRILAMDVFAQLSHPPHDISAMDGYAIRHEDIAQLSQKTSSQNIGPFTIIGESAAGHPFKGVVNPDEAVRIFTGGYCPDGADTIIIQEDTISDGETLTIHDPAPKGTYIRPKGNDFMEGQLIAKAGDRLTTRLLALMASAGIREFSACPRPRVAIISTGDELVAPGFPVQEGQIISSNGLFLKNYLCHIGADAIDLGIIADDDAALNQAFHDAADADLIITSGGASVGNHDGVAKAMGADDRRDTTLDFWRIAMRPGKPLIFGRVHGTPLLGLPGNPVSTGVCAMVFAATAIRAMTGQDLSQNWGMPIRHGTLGTDLKANDKRQEYLRARLSYDDAGHAILTPFEKQDSGMMHHFTTADALVIRPPFAEPAAAGTTVAFLPITDGV